MLCAIQLEILIRELDGVLYQALHLASQGLSTLIGDRMVNEYIMGSDKPIIYIDSDQQRTTNTHVLNNGGVVLNSYSEGQGFVDDPPEMQKNFAKVIDYSTLILSWGDTQTEILKELIPVNHHQSIVTTGHSSFDLASPSFTNYYRNEEIVEAHGEDYILINTSFGMFNHEMGFEYYIKMLSKMDEWKVYGTTEHREYLENWCFHQEKTALALIALARKMAKTYPRKHVIIRPHPAEKSSYYTDKTSDLPNIIVTKQGSAREWIATSKAVIHHDCTTGLEAMLMGKVVIQFEPYEGIEGSATTMQQIGIRATSSDEVLDILDQGTIPDKTRDSIFSKIRPTLKNLDINASGAIAKIAREHAQSEQTWIPEALGLWGNFKCWRKHISKLLRAHQPGRNGRKVRYALNKFPRLTKEEIVTKLDKLRHIEPTLPQVSVTQLCMNTFLIRPTED